MSQKVYVLLTRSNTLVSRIIYQVTKDEFTHCSLSIDQDMQKMYSFCRRYPDLPLPAGFTSESIYQGFYKKHHTIPCKLYSFEVSDDDYVRLKVSLEQLMEKSSELKYDLLGTFYCRLNRAHERYNHRYCSWFVSELLGKLGVLNFNKHYSLVRPVDFTDRADLTFEYSGTVGDLAKKFEEKKHKEEVVS
jgi:hypothetical protein